MTNADMIAKYGIRPEDLYFNTGDYDIFGNIILPIYDGKSRKLIGQLTIDGSHFAGKIFKPIEVWLCCDNAFAVYEPEKVISS